MKTKPRRRLRSNYINAGFKPGSLPVLSAADPLYSPKAMRVIGYDAAGCAEIEIAKVAEIEAFAKKWPKLWIEVEGLGNAALLMELAECYKLHPLTMEDIFDARHQPKIEEYDQYVFMMLKQGTCAESLDIEQVSLVLMENTVISICEKPGDGFKLVRERIRTGTGGKIRQFGSDFLACALIDATVESFYPVLGTVRGWLDAVEDTFLDKTGPKIIRRIHDIKHDLLLLHSAVWPLQEIMMTLAKHGLPLVRAETAHYMRDTQDQARQVKELAEFYRMIASDLMNTTLAFSDNKANEVMKVLTMVSALFIPLSFLTGLYGMNFDTSISHYNMPELKNPYGYPIVLSVMATIALATLVMFWRKGWFRGDGK